MEYEMKEKKTGTTTVGIVCKDAVVLAADKKATMGFLVASTDAEKIMQLDEHIAMTIAGVSGDTQALNRYIRAELKLYRLREEQKIPVEAAANLIANILYSRRFYPYVVQLIVGGFDEKPKLYSFDMAGALQEEKEYFSTGSGSPTAFGVLEDNYRKDMTIEEAKKLAIRAVRAATKRDVASGGRSIDVVVIDSNGFHRVPEEEVKKLAES
ncbi:MAG TPA: archaeal proteasome endopeptidase complex subunit beta [Candidatus Aenigmarchaeota archaeon]|nr:archaeal proteasome endopeptidase complex subunit beta [Candidatus Aenigmarchaeota archaeon]